MNADPNFAQIAALIGESSRAAMLAAVLGGKALTASELAAEAGISPPTASSHLARLVAGGLLAVTTTGRHRYYQLAAPQVARVLESLAALAPPAQVTSLRQSDAARAVRFARTCYDHLAGTVGVALTARLLERDLLVQEGPRYEVTAGGWAWMAQHGLDAGSIRQGRRATVRACLDWSERRYHVAGAFGAALTEWMFAQGWITRIPSSRAVRLTTTGCRGFQQEWDLSFEQRPLTTAADHRGG